MQYAGLERPSHTRYRGHLYRTAASALVPVPPSVRDPVKTRCAYSGTGHTPSVIRPGESGTRTSIVRQVEPYRAGIHCTHSAEGKWLGPERIADDNISIFLHKPLHSMLMHVSLRRRLQFSRLPHLVSASPQAL